MDLTIEDVEACLSDIGASYAEFARRALDEDGHGLSRARVSQLLRQVGMRDGVESRCRRGLVSLCEDAATKRAAQAAAAAGWLERLA